MSSTDFSTTEAKASYGIGLQMGQQVSGAFPGVGIDAVIAGIRDAFEGKESQISHDDLNAAFQEIQKIVEAENAEKAKQFAAEGEAFLAENAKREEVTVLDSGLQYEVITEGSGEKPTADSTVRTHYAGTLVSGQEFDSSYKRGEPAEFPVGGVIKGWTEALQNMPVGSKWKLYVPHNLAYGEQGAGGVIGPYQALIFEIELLDIVS
ncbi:FKBP-type peptidyl-prolyl cis-trans isomerase [Kangiella sediminilitoris]|uniref:Peptidyl-prolyl cis-trans isomerase n=1 Tax=Kangiella sediminilitoris TaxID=1144748 RepID=A0A1B3B9F5_9GAMM|nr:FKBP-type peptidyl-prolyl cis-trans isomerase [Kangiella sediminilitoris]AOE49429.1 Peptidyl-prolyl cis-trans isomerase [Kangiella sediminilitoris]